MIGTVPAGTDALGARLDRIRSLLGVDTAAVLLVDQTGKFLVASAARGIEEELRQGSRVPIGRGFAGRVAAEDRPVIIDEVTPANVVNPLLLRRGIVSMLGVPLHRDGQVSGVLHVGTLTRRDFSAEDVSAVEDAASALARDLTDEQNQAARVAAETLQASLVPRLPAVAGLDLAARYVPSSGRGVGGDWYDVFTLDTRRVAIAVGDVMGHGLQAATVMGRLRSTLRAYALIDDDPAAVLRLLDRTVHRFDEGHFTTVLYGILDTVTGHLQLSRAGHLPPLMAGPDRPGVLLDGPVDLPLGVDESHARHTTGVDLAEDAVLCLFTDGLVDAHLADVDSALQRMGSVLGRYAGHDAERMCAELMTASLGDQYAVDDISLLVVRRIAGAAHPVS